MEAFVKAVLAEDVGRGDLYSLVADASPAVAHIIAKSNGVLAAQSYIDTLSQLEGFAVDWMNLLHQLQFLHWPHNVSIHEYKSSQAFLGNLFDYR